MTKYEVKVIDGPVSIETLKSSPDPDFTTPEKNLEVMTELMKREPLFHREESGILINHSGLLKEERECYLI